MRVPRSLQVLRTRWWIVIAIAVIGAGVALLAALVRNAGLEPLFEGVAPVTILRLDEEEDTRYEGRLNTALAQAEGAVASELAHEQLSVTSDPEQEVIQFVATAPSADEALSAATDLRALYLNSRPADTAEDQLAPVLDALATEIALVEADLNDLSRIGADEVAEVQRQTLSSELATATKELVTAQARLVDPSLTAEQRQAVEAQESAAEATIAAIEPLLESLPASSESVADTQARLDVLVLQRRLRQLESQYISAAMRQPVSGTDGLIGTPTVVNRSGAPVSPLLSVMVGLFTGALLGGMAVLVSDRQRDPVRAVDDVSGLTAIRVSQRPREMANSVDWYQTAHGNARRIDIQALRTRIDRLVGRGKIVLIAGVDAPSRDVQDVAADLASAVAATGRTVLLIDTSLAEESAAPWEDAGTTLSDILSAQDGAVPDRSIIKRLLWDRSQVAPNLMVVPAGTVDDDPVDALAGLNFAAVVDEARDLVDLVILASADVADPTSEAVAGRARLAILVAQKDHTRKEDVMEGAASLEQLGVAVAAVAVLVGSSSSAKARSGSKSIPRTPGLKLDVLARHRSP